MTSLDTAIRLHQQGQINRAEQTYQEILAGEPNHPGALHLLGVIRQQQGRHEEALELIGRAIAISPAKPAYQNNYGAALHALDRLAEAEESFRRALAICPNYADALANLGMVQAALGEDDAALASLGRALDLCPQHPDALRRRAALFGKLGKTDEAIRCFQRAVAACPTAETFVQFGNMLMSAGQVNEAAAQYRTALQQNPNDAFAHFNLGQPLDELRDAAKARRHFSRAAELRPDKALWRLRGLICGPAVFENQEEIEEYCGRVGRVLEEWRSGNQTPSPPAPLPERARGDSLPSPPEGNPKSELRHPRPASECPIQNFKSEIQNNGPHPESLPKCARGVDAPRETGWKPILPDGPLPERARRDTLDHILEAGVFPSFGLAYHGRDQRQLKERFAALYEPYFRDQPPPQPSELVGRGRVGFVVTQRHEGIFLRCMGGILENLDPERFEIVLLCSRRILETLRKAIRRRDARFVPFGDSLSEAAARIRQAACDLIYYWEVGSDALNYFLPFARLAPLQCTSHGSLTTTGVPTVDYFISSQWMETDAADEHYSERLWRARGLLMCRDRLPPFQKRPRSYWGLSETGHWYLCFQNPLKLHPDFDDLLAGILRADPSATVVLLSDASGQVAAALRRRFARWISPSPPAPLPKGERRTADRVVFLPRLPLADYCALLQAADVVLDPLHYGAGSSCYDIFSFNLPMVTLPTERMPGRVACGFYRKMGVEDLVACSADAYVGTAVQVATDAEYRRFVTERIAQRSDVLFNDLEAVREHERFFEEALSYAK